MSKIAKQAEHNGKETWGIWLKKIIQICNEIISISEKQPKCEKFTQWLQETFEGKEKCFSEPDGTSFRNGEWW